MVNRRFDFKLVLAATATCLLGVDGAAAAETHRYVEMDLAMNVASSLGARGSDNDWGTKCDLIINPSALETRSECDAVPPPTSWANAFGRGRGAAAGLAVGYDWGTIRLELEFFRRSTTYDERVDTDIFDDVTVDKQEQEIEQAYGEIDDLRSHGAFVNVYYDFGPSSAWWTPYVGIGVGGERTTLDYRSVWKRNDDPQRISTFTDPALRAKLAGTTTIGDERLVARAFGYQFLAGVDYRLTPQAAVGVKMRWAGFARFKSGETAWRQLRSHESHVGRGDPVRYTVTTDDNRSWSIGVGFKYRF